jgi:signal transduction histidine kinase
VTAAIIGTPYLVFGHHNPALHLVIDSVDTSIALLLAYLLYGRFRRTDLVQDLLLSQALLLLAVTGPGLTAALSLLETDPRTLEVWLPRLVRAIAGALVLLAAVAGQRTIPDVRRTPARLGPWVLVAVSSLVLWLSRDSLPTALAASPPSSAQQPVITGHALLIAAQGLTGLCFLVAAVSFSRQATRRRDELLRWLGPACALAAFARVNYVLFPSLYSDWFYTGDILRTGSYLLLLVGAAREISLYWAAQARAAVLEDRRRLSRELHDGVVQELTFIRIVSEDVPDPALRERIIGSCDRGLDEARAAIDALGRPAEEESLGCVLRRSAQQVAERHGGRVVVDFDDGLDADIEQRHALVRITREAVSNALRHGGARSVRVVLHNGVGCNRLVVSDDGSGFDTTLNGHNGYGLTSMRERAAALPGSFSVESAPGAGTTVEVTW